MTIATSGGDPPSTSAAVFLEALSRANQADEATVAERLVALAALPADMVARIEQKARALVGRMRAETGAAGGLDAFLAEYRLSSREGVVLMCLAEALLRIPDADTIDSLIRDKLAPAAWDRHLGQSDSLLVNASTWALMLTGRLLQSGTDADLGGVLKRLFARSGEPLIRQAITAAIRIMARQFVMGRSIEEALALARPAEAEGYRHSYDMLGEGARRQADAESYYRRYLDAIAAIAKTVVPRALGPGGRVLDHAPSLSVKLSALHPRYEPGQARRVLAELAPRLVALAKACRESGIGLTVDAEEAERLDLSLALFARAAQAPDLAGWDGLGLALQAYQKRAPTVIEWLKALAHATRRRLPVRLVKGAYWDSEIKRAQERGLDHYPVFTRKVATDVSYIVCARALLADPAAFHPQFATHNAHTLATILELAGGRRDFEFQRLHGMGEALYRQVVGADKSDIACRVYAPVGSHQDLLPYLVRRLLENGANTSFVNRIVDQRLPLDQVVADPVATLAKVTPKAHPRIALPRDLFMPERRNSRGIDLSDAVALERLLGAMAEAGQAPRQAGPVVAGEKLARAPSRAVANPADQRQAIGSVVEADDDAIERALITAHAGARDWDRTPVETRAFCLERAADLFEARMAEAMALIVAEGGRTVADAHGELRETVDFCRYYAARARADLVARALPGPTGEHNRLSLHGRGVFACIAPWNFPLAIFTGQIAAALVAGNSVIAKPAEQTPLVAAFAVRLLLDAGVPGSVLQFLPGDGATVGARLVGDERVAGVAFTGSTETARAINRTLAARNGPIAALIAETGGVNAMIVDSSALAEQVVADVITSAFNSAGQRCSALRVLCVQDDIADHVLDMLAGAMDELAIGDPASIETDIGPVIDQPALAALERHAQRMTAAGRLLHALGLPESCGHGTFFAPRLFAVETIGEIGGEVFGPILHVRRWRSDALDDLLDEIAATGFGLTLGIHSRIDDLVPRVARRLKIGNVYVNRSMIGAVVEAQPFGGEGLSGTGPKAGGPHYLPRFATERSLSTNTAAAGGNASLLTLQDDEAAGDS